MEGSDEQYTSVMTVKSSITGIGWKPQYLSILKKLVHDVHVIVPIQLNLNLEEYAVQGFCKEVFLSLLDSKTVNVNRLSGKVKAYREMINKYKASYCRDLSFTPIKLPSAQQIVSYEATKIQTACTNAITKDFGNKLRMVVNKLIGLKQQETKTKIKSNILEPATQLKLAISSRDISRIPKEFQDQKAIINCIKDIFSAYPETYKFKKDSIYYDAIANPGKHLLAYFKLAEICEANKFKLFQCFPVRKTFIPPYMTIDTMILNNHILKNSQSKLDKGYIWGKVLNLSSKPFKDQGLNSSIKFRGTIMTDGIGISVIKQNFDTSKGGTSNPKASLVEDEELKYIEQIPNEELRSTDGKCVFIDPGRRDLIYCMHEDSTVNNKKIYRYTRNQKAKETKSTKIKKLRQQLKPKDIQDCEDKLSKCSPLTVKKGAFVEYLKIRAEVTCKMQEYYSNEDVEKDKRKKDLIPFRKMKLSAHINEIQSTKRLSKNIRKKFGKDCILILGNWSASRTRFHEPIKGNGLRNSLRKEGFKVYLLDEFKTSSICPSCENKLATFKECINPRPYRRSANPKVTCHGLLRCLNQNCLEKQALTEKDQENIKYRLWNRDLAAVLNFRKIVISLRTTSQKLAIFLRSQKDSIKRKNYDPKLSLWKTLIQWETL
ncbi:hypothetical protein BD770DRAFT_412005 [Pilaira anomala]|nr:hypothetical protein BD770DRAFT_412005 [Pilaira anomala]